MYLNVYPVVTITQRTIHITIKCNNLCLPNGICPRVKNESQKSSYAVYGNNVAGGSFSSSILRLLCGVKFCGIRQVNNNVIF